jgi:hypothetical protein
VLILKINVVLTQDLRWQQKTASGAVLRMPGGSGVSSSLPMKIEIFFLGYPPGSPLGYLACAEDPVASSDAECFLLRSALDRTFNRCLQQIREIVVLVFSR